jgi:polyisoprenoid-binding protein YceI
MLGALAVCLALSGTAAADPVTQDPTKAPRGEYVLDKRHASLIAKIPHMGGFSRFTVRFDRLDGAFDFDPANWTTTHVTINVDPKSVNSNVPGFDDEISGHYFDAGHYPTMTFVSTAATGEAGHGSVSGDLTFRGKTQPVTFDVTFNGVGPGLLGAGTRMGFSAVGKIKRSDFGLKVPIAGDDVDLQFEVELVKK